MKLLELLKDPRVGLYLRGSWEVSWRAKKAIDSGQQPLFGVQLQEQGQ